MRISVVTDIHGNVEALARVAERAEKLVILGDLLDYVDYHDPERGILGEVFGVDAVVRFSRLRAAGEFAALHRLNRELWSTISDPVDTLRGIVRARYDAIRAVLPTDTVLTLGNVDVAEEWTAVAGHVVPFRDAEVVEIDGVRFGFVAGGVSRSAPPRAIRDPHASPWRPFVRAQDDYRSVVDGLDAVDVLCTHIPPDIAALRYDVIPGRLEMAAPGALEYLDRVAPPLMLFGHVHQPLAARTRYRRTECVNAGHFQRREQELIIDTDRVLAERIPGSPSDRYASTHG